MKSKVYFIQMQDGPSVEKQAEAMSKIYDFAGTEQIIKENDFVAIKVHVGEKGNTTHVKPDLIKVLADKVKNKKGYPFLTETSTLYKGDRENAVKHILHAHSHGSSIENTGAPFIMADGLLGNTEGSVSINGELHKTVDVAREILSADVILNVSHVTGHMITGIGACIKNLGMGLASRKGKRSQHSAMKPSIKKECVFCKKCIQWCPEEAIIEKDGKAFIIQAKCVGCGECLTVCRYDAVNFDWQAEAGFTQKSMAEHALGVVKDKKCFHFNVMIDMTQDCDCWGKVQKKIIPDLGILASCDPVALDMATLELTGKIHGKTLAELSYGNQNALIQINHSVKIGMGSKEYELVTMTQK